jgi:hypothetical protein
MSANNQLEYYWYDTQSLYNSVSHPNNASEFDRFFDTSESGVSFGGSGSWNSTIHWGNSNQNTELGSTNNKPSYLPGDGYSWKVEGYLVPPESGTYTIGVDGDDAIDVKIGDEFPATWYGGHGFDNNYGHNGTISLTGGESYTFRARMEEGGGGDGISVAWIRPSSSSYELIPTSAFSTVPPTQIPSYSGPSNLSVSNTSSSQISLDWSNASFGGYSLYRDQNSGSTASDYSEIDKTSTSSYTDSGLEDGEQYYYRVGSDLGSQQNPADNALQLQSVYGDGNSGSYYIDLPGVGVTETYCLLDSTYNEGGWMLAMKADRGSRFDYSSSYWTNNNTYNTSSTDRSTADAKFDVFNQFQGKELLAIWPDLNASGGCISNAPEWTWYEYNYPRVINQNTSTMLNLFQNANREFITDAKTWCGWGGGNVFSSQEDVRFYGFNYTSNGNDGKSRWGFGWNENGGGLYPGGDETSPDVTGGIGIYHRGETHSAGDIISCCEDNTGFNRSARVEIYVR